MIAATPQELADAIGCDLGSARRILGRMVSEGGADLADMKKAVRRDIRERAEALDWSRPRVVDRVQDGLDHSVRYLFRLADGAQVEAVRIPLEKPGRFTVCLSSQVGCAMRCDFCATGRLGLTRNLTADEIVGTFLTVRDEAPGRVTGAVFMGQGEPLHNLDQVVRAARTLARPCGGRISAKAISISTVGLVPQIHAFAEQRLPFRLVVSLTSALPDKRKQLLPVAGKWSLDELAEALRALHAVQGRRQTLAWVLLGGVNDTPDEVAAIQRHFGDLPLRINLIDVNGDASDGAYRRSTDDERNAFFDALQALGAPVVRRYSVGAEQNSACGMLAAQARALQIPENPPSTA